MSSTGDDGNIDEVENTIKLLEEGEKYINTGEHKNIVVILGNTGAGKSTFTQFIVGDNNRLRSKEVLQDCGEFIIEDDDDKIGRSTITSKTIFPNLAFDNKFETAYYDCPGFNDTRSTANDIASTFFIKKTLDSAETVKLLFVVSYYSVRVGVSREEFIHLIQHATNFIKNIDKFENSTALIVTKVDKEYMEVDSTISMVSDSKVINKIARFLEEVKNHMMNTLENSMKNDLFYTNAIKLIGMLLKKEEDKYVKIVLFRRPDKAGPLSQIAIIQNSRQSIEQMIHSNITFVTKNSSDFGYTISDRSKHDIFALAEKINRIVTCNVVAIGRNITECYNTRINQSDNMRKLQCDLNEAYDILSKMIKEVSELVNPKDFISTLVSDIPRIGIKISEDTLFSIQNQNKYLEFLNIVSTKKLPARPLEWMKPLVDSLEFLNNSKNWCNVIINLYNWLSQYSVQKDVTKYNVSNVNDWGTTGNVQGIIINQNNWKMFSHKIESCVYTKYGHLNDFQIEGRHLKELNSVLDITLKGIMVTNICLESGTLIAKGNYIKISEINNLSLENIKYVYIYAINTVFIDADLIKVGTKMEIVIIAPTWEVIGTRKICLDGAPGMNIKKADDGVYPHVHGKDGVPGLPGGAAGSFFGIGDTFINEDNLTVSVSGGNGGQGQSGGDGAVGIAGDNPDLHVGEYRPVESQTKYKHEKTATTLNGTSIDSTLVQPFISKIINIPTKVFISLGNKIHCDYYNVYGTHGSSGGNGGNGGVGGLGGYAGLVEIIGLSTQPEILTTCANGDVGMGGNCGFGGTGGDNGKLCVYSETNPSFGWVIARTDQPLYLTLISEDSNGQAASGEDGVANMMSGEIKQPEKNMFQNKCHVIEYYKIYLTENLDTVITKDLSQFLQKLNKNEAIINTTNVS